MKFFIDTANLEDIKKANDMGVICGVTTNPSLIAKEGRDFNEVIKEIIAPLLRQLNTGEIYYSYDTDTRILTIKTNVVEVFDNILNGENSSLKTKIKERIKSDFLKRIVG